MSFISGDQIWKNLSGDHPVPISSFPEVCKKFVLRALDTIIEYHAEHYRAEYGQETDPQKDIKIIPIISLRAGVITDNVKHLNSIFQYTALLTDPEVSGLVPKEPFVNVACPICGNSMRKQREEMRGFVGVMMCEHCHKSIHIDFSAMRW